MYKEIFKDKLFVYEQSVYELANIYNIPLPEVNKDYARQCEPKGYDDEWRGGIKTLQQAKDILAVGWNAGAVRASTLMDKLESNMPTVKTRKRRQAWMDEGDGLDIDRALAGQWDVAYRSTRREFSSGSNCVTLNVGWGGNCDMTSEQLFWSGAVMLALSDILENAGYSTRINAVYKGSFWGNKDRYVMGIIVAKDHGEPLRVDGLAGVVCHAGIFRTYGFRSICNTPWDVGSSLGRAVGWSAMLPIMQEVGCTYFEEGTINVNDCYSEAAARVEVKRILTQVYGEGE